MDTMKDTTMQHVTDAVIAEIKRAAEHPAKAPVIVRADTMLGVLTRLEEVEKERCDTLSQITQRLSRLADENMLLRAEIAATSFADAYQGAMEDVAIWKKRALEAEDLNRKFVAEINGPAYMGEPAQPAPSVPEGISRVSLDFYWDREKQHHIPFVRVEFEPVPAGSPNDAKGWQDRDRFAALITVAPEAKP